MLASSLSCWVSVQTYSPVTETCDITHIGAICLTITADIQGIFGGRPTIDSTLSSGIIAGIVYSQDFLVGCHVLRCGGSRREVRLLGRGQ